MNFVRMNPTHAQAFKPVNEKGPATNAFKHVMSSVKGQTSSYLGHFRNPFNIMQGHNTNGAMRHPGFVGAQSKIASKEGVSKKAAGAILASSTRKASAKAKKKNPRLKKVK